MYIKYISILVALLIFYSSSKGQIGAASIGSVTIGTTLPGKDEALGKSTLPVCFPGNYSCNNAASSTYTFTGEGNWNVPENWEHKVIPPPVLTAGFQIIIAPAGMCESVLNISQAIMTGAQLTVLPGKKLRVIGGVLIE